MNPLIKEYGLFIIITLLMLIVVVPLITSWFGVLGTYAGYAATSVVLAVAYWINKKAKKEVIGN